VTRSANILGTSRFHPQGFYFPQILDILLILFCTLLAREPEDLIDLAQRTDLSKRMFMLLRKLDKNKDIMLMLSSGVSDAELKRAGVLRTERSPVRVLKGMFDSLTECICS
jgi:hypothetical protein